MKTRYFVAGVLTGILCGLLIGYRLGSRWTQKTIDRLCAELRFDTGLTNTNKPINMAAAIGQVQTEADKQGLPLADISARDARTIRMRVAGGPEVSLQWRDMGEDTAASRSDLNRRLSELMVVLKKASEAQAAVREVDISE